MKNKAVLKDTFLGIRKDKVAIITFIVLLIKTFLFYSILLSYGAAKIIVIHDKLVLINFYIYTLFILAFMSFTFLFKKRVHLILLIILDLSYSVLLIGNLWIYRSFNSFLSLHLISETQNLNNLSNSIFSMFRTVDLVFVLFDILLLATAFYFKKYYTTFPRIKGAFRDIAIFSIGLIMLFHLAYDFRGGDYSGPDLFKTEFLPFSTMRNLSPLGYLVHDSKEFIVDHLPYKLDSAEKTKIANWFDFKNEKLSPNKDKGIFKGKNLIVIQVESLENFVIGNSYENQEITPNLNKLVKDSYYFSNYFEQVNNGTSADADLMTNASVFPVRRGGTFFRFPNNTYNTIPELLKSENYYSMALHSDHGYYWNVDKALANFGFNEFKDMDDFDKSDTFYMGLTDESFFKQVSTKLKKVKEPFYAYTVTSTSHVPFVMPEKFKTLNFSKDFAKTVMGEYFHSVNYADRQIGAFIDQLDKAGLLDNTIIAIYGDHNGVHKYFGDKVANITPQETWWNNDHRLPLIIYSKGMDGKVITTNGGQIDLLPTLAYTLGIDEQKYEDTSIGRNLLNTKRSYALLNDGTIKGEETLSEKEIDMVKESFNLSDDLIRANAIKDRIK
ncbi:MAG: LTA synthase family protein [Clostridiaceae bacterium]|nr:LTA synthase family protein [Clostridiaceae bacterium]